MPSLRHSVGSLTSLVAFEAAARLSSFTLAAEELGVSQAAVSRQIKLLEADINTPLFIRANRGVTLTRVGVALASTLSLSLGRIAEMLDTLRQPSVPSTVAVGATLAFTHYWLLPRLPDFRASHPEIHLKLVAQDEPIDLRRDRLDVVVRYGQPPFDDARSIASHADEVFPVCSPALLKRMGLKPALAPLSKLPLIASDTIDPTWLSWKRWASMVGGVDLGRHADRSTLRLNHYTDSIQAAIVGQGVALGWRRLVANFLDEERLVPVGGRSITPPERYHIVVPLEREPTGEAKIFLDWIAARFLSEA